MYIKLGTSIDFRVSGNPKLDFVNSEMKQYTDEILNQMGKPSLLVFPIRPGFGLRWGHRNNISAGFEITAPIYSDTKAFAVKGSASGPGIQFNLFIPIKKK
jgi:hypothetical protein